MLRPPLALLGLASLVSLASLACGLAACGNGTPPVAPAASTSAPASATASTSAPPPASAPLAMTAKWAGPYGGVPPLDKVRVADFKPALTAAMDAYRRDVSAITEDPAAPTFANTIARFEDAGRTFNDVNTLFGIWSSSMNDKAFQAVEREMAPVLSAFSDELTQNAALFKRIQAVYDSPEKAKLTAEEQRLVWLHTTNFARAGARLDAPAKKRVAEINARLATLYTEFSQNLLADEEGFVTTLESEADLAGLPDSVKKGAAAAAEAKGQKGKWAFTNTRSSVQPFLTFSSRRDLREKVWKNFVQRGDNHDAHDNNAHIAEILKLRAERAKLLGYPTHAHWRLEDSMAKTPERAMTLMEAVWKPAVLRVREEVRDMQAIADKEPGRPKIAPWDYRYYAEKVRKARYDLDQNEIKPYLQLDQLRLGLFYVAGELFGFELVPAAGVPVYHPDVTVYEVREKAGGKHVGLWYFDPYARPGKRSGAWMNAYRNQERFKGEVSTIVSNNANFVKGNPGEPVLISWDDARTLFHEFGHALHGLSSNVTYPSVSGTSVARDYVEFPSQLLEHWLDTPEVLSRFALHYQTRAPIPEALVAKIRKAGRFNEGFSTVEYLSAALVDMKLHLAPQAGAQPFDAAAFERDTLKSLGMPAEIVMRHRTAQFAHVFAGDGYSAGYYSYLWSDTLTADAFEAFKEGKGPYDKAVAERLRKSVFSAGNTVDPADAYRQFRGRDAGVSALMRKRGFPETPATAPAPAAKKPKKK
ncbi:MAG: M3 family metallopeptidase [Myxococcales bacterium]|nr:M3 family metallopeptidase [Myxococcales bacterium]HQY61148.1 M3 family metallopeptidase [Polyangiaceae bacterium]